MTAPRTAMGVALGLMLAAVAPLSLTVPAYGAEETGTEKISVATGGTAGDGASHSIDISADGTIVAFGSAATNLVEGGTSRFDIYVRDLSSGVTEIVSVNAQGQSGSSTSLWPTISADGTRVAFHSIARNLVEDDLNGTADVFVHDRTTGVTTLVSAAATGGVANGRSQRADISADGKHIVFESAATDIVDGVPANTGQVYIHHLETGETELVSQSSSGSPANLSAGEAAVSGDGRYVVFRSFATNLDPDGLGYVHVRDTVAGTTSLLAESGSLQAGNPSISDDGEWIFYEAGFSAYLTRRTGDTRTRAPLGGVTTSRFSGDGRYVAAFSSQNRLSVWDRFTDEVVEASLNADGTPVATGSNAPLTFGPPGIDGIGRVVGFWTTADGVVAGDTGGVEDVFVRDRGDLLGPAVSDPIVSSDELLAGEPVTITSTANDSGRGGAVVASAELSVDGGDWVPMDPVDGAYDEVEEPVTATLDDLTTGVHEVCVRATDGRGNTTVRPSCTSFVLASSAYPLAVTIMRVATAPGIAPPDPLRLDRRLYARVWAVPGDGSLPRPGDWDYDTRDDSDANSFRYIAGEIEPFGTHGETISTGVGTAIVRIEAGLSGPGGGPIDLSPRASDTGLVLTVDLETGEWSNLDGLAPYPVSCVSSPSTLDAGTLPGQLCFGISTMSTSGDMDDDGLLDLWESIGVNTDEDPAIELDLPGWGATPDHKDLFVEYDVEDDAIWNANSQQGLIAVSEAFARAPVDAGGTPNPDGQPGIRLWIDAPPVLDSNGQPNSDSARLALAGASNGDRVSTGEVCGVRGGALDPNDDEFYRTKRANFDPDRRWVFRYGLKESNDGGCDSGGQAEIGGNDLVVLNSDSRTSQQDPSGLSLSWPGGETFMHELGHTLGLRHGGFQNRKYKPNYVSLMNYTYSFGLRLASSPTGFLDFSPALPPPTSGDLEVPSGPRPALLPPINEISPPQGDVLGAGRDHEIWYAALDCRFVAAPVASPFTIQPGQSVPAVPHPGLDGDPGDLPGSCVRQQAPPGSFQVHDDHDDWSAIELSFHRSGYAADGAVDPSDDEDLPTDEEIAALRAMSVTTDLALEPPSPIEGTAGEPFSVPVTVNNLGTVSAHSPVLTSDPGAGVVAQPSDACSPDATTCTVVEGPLVAGTAQTLSLPFLADAPGRYEITFAVAGGFDGILENNRATAVVTVGEGGDPTPPSDPSPSSSPDPTASGDPRPSTSPDPGSRGEPTASPETTTTDGPSPSATPDPTTQDDMPTALPADGGGTASQQPLPTTGLPSRAGLIVALTTILAGAATIGLSRRRTTGDPDSA